MRTRLTPLLAVPVGLLCVLLAACGSQLDPQTVAQVNGVTGADGTGLGDAAAPGGTDDALGTGDTAAGTDTGSGSPGDSSAPGDSSGADDGGSDDAPEGTGDNSATGNTKAASCDGFKNQTGVTDETITIANASDLSGPVPGIFEAAPEAVRAYAAYFNANNDICGRKLQVISLDSRTDAGGDQQAYAQACEKAFAVIGSMSAFDSGGAGTAQSCGIPDLRSATTTPERQDCTTCFAAQSVDPGMVGAAMPKFFLDKHKDAAQHAAVLFINAGAATVNAQSFRNAWSRVGWKIDYFQGIDVSEFNYAPYVQQLKDKGIKLVNYTGPYQNTVKLLEAMKQQGYKPDVFIQDSTIYDSRFIEEAGSSADGVYAFTSTKLFDDTSVKEMQLYRAWLQQVKPGAVPNFYGLYAWSAARLFVEKAVGLGGKLSRATMVGALKGVKDWTGNGLHVPQQVGARTTADCVAIIQYSGGKWRKVSSGNYLCGPLVSGG